MVGLPKVPVSTVEIVIPSTKKKVRFSRFRCNEEKILLIAKQSGETIDILQAIKDVIASCAQDPTFDVNKLAAFDIEYLFLKLHAASVSNVAKIVIKDREDEKEYNFDIDLDKVEVDESERKDATVKMNDHLAAHFIYPPASLYGDRAIMDAKDPTFEVVVKCLDKIYQDETVIEAKNFSRKELEDWVKELPYDIYEKVKEFFNNIPHISYTISYKNSKGTDQKIVLSTLADFFML
jgi:hypothetical protein